MEQPLYSYEFQPQMTDSNLNGAELYITECIIMQ